MNKKIINKSHLRLSTYNCKHFIVDGPKGVFISEIIMNCDILLLQEHWLYESKICKKEELGDSVCDWKKFNGSVYLG